jgi:flavodoxin
MKTLIVYDSQYGNTEQVARAIADALGGSAVRAGQANAAAVKEYELLIAGSPTQGGRPTPALKAFLQAIPAGGLKDVKVAAFDTRVPSQGVFLKILLGVIGYAAGKIDAPLRAKGGTQAAAPEGFYVKGKEGPLQDGELERAAAWAKGLVASDTPARILERG